MTNVFDKQQSQIVKGVAILMMLWHHCFLPGRFNGFDISFVPLSMSMVVDLASFFKLCVSLFAFVSGYGLYLSFRKWHNNNPDRLCTRWLWQRYVRTFSAYWLVVVLSWIICGLINGRPAAVYVSESRIAGAVYAVAELLGLSNLFGTPSINGTWWYMSAAFLFICITPILFAGFKKFGVSLTLLMTMIVPRLFGGYPGSTAPLSFVPAFTLGMAAADVRLFEMLDSRLSGKKNAPWLCSFLSLFAVVACFLIGRRVPTKNMWDMNWNLFAVVVIVFIYRVLGRIPGLRSVLAFLGRHSANIFMVHTFIRDVYCRSFIYGQGHFLLIIGVLLAISLLISFALEGLKKLICYDRFTAKLETLTLPPVVETK